MSRFVENAARYALAVAVAITVYFAFVAPSAPAELERLGDKTIHMLTFTVLTVLGRLAFPQTSSMAIVVGLALFGGGIELVQGLPWLGRDRELLDFVADCVGILSTVIIIWLIRVTRAVGSRLSPGS